MRDICDLDKSKGVNGFIVYAAYCGTREEE